MNRFTNFTPQQYVESFVETPTMDFPFQEAMMIEGIKEKRNNEFATTLGELSAGDPQAGYLTEGLRKQYMADKEKTIADLQVKMSNSNMTNTTKKQELMKEAFRLKNDPRLRVLQQDVELRPHITKGMFDEGYGVSSFYAGMNPQTIKDIEAGKITSIDASTYDSIVDPGKMAAMKPTLEMIVADSFSDYTSTKNADGTISLNSADKSLDMNTFEKRITPFVSAMINEDGSIKMSEGMTPDMKNFIRAQSHRFAKEGKKYEGQDLLTDIKDVASLMIHINKTEATTEKDSDNTKGKKGEVRQNFLEDGALLNVSTIPYASYDIKTVNQANTSIGVKQEGTNTFVVAKNDQGGEDKYNLKDMISPDQDIRQKTSSEIKSAFYRNEEGLVMSQVKEVDVNGVKMYVRDGKQVSLEQLNRDILDRSNERYTQSLKYTKSLHETELELAKNGIKLSDLEYNYTPKEEAVIKNWKPTSQANKMGYLTLQEKYAINQKCEDCEFTIDGNTLVPTRIFEKHKKYNDILNQKIQENFNNTEISAVGINLVQPSEYAGLSDIPDSHKKIFGGIETMVKTQTPGFGMNGKSFESFYAPESNSNKGKNINSLPMLDGTNANFSNGQFKPLEIFWDSSNKEGSNGRWMARGNFEATTEKDGNAKTKIVSKSLDLDVTDFMKRNILTQDDNFSIMVNDQALDAVINMPTGLGGVVSTGLTPEEEKKYGEIYLSKDIDERYSLHGNVVFNGKILNIEDPAVAQELGLSSNKNLSKQSAVDGLAQMLQTRFRDIQKGESTPEQQVYENLPVSEKRLPSVQAAFQAIENNESATYGGYDAMNTGGSNDGKTAYGSSTGTTTFGKPLTQLTVGQIKNLQSSDGKKKELHAAGKFQIIPSTFKNVAEQLGLSDSELFNEETQLKMGNFLFEETVKNAADQAIKEGYSITETEIFNRLFTKGKKFEDSGKPIGWMVHQWRGLENAKGDEKRAILTAATQYLKEKGYDIYNR
jgi:hypothetical protein